MGGGGTVGSWFRRYFRGQCDNVSLCRWASNKSHDILHKSIIVLTGSGDIAWLSVVLLTFIIYEDYMKNTKLEVAVAGTLSYVDAFDAVIGEQLGDIAKSAEMLVSVERWESDTLSTTQGIASILYGVLISQGEPVSFAWHEVVRLRWGDAYRSARGADVPDNTVNQGWSRSFKMVTDGYGLTKPKAEGKDAEKKAEQRAKQEEKIAAYIDTPTSELKDKARALFDKAADGGKDAPKLRAEANLIAKAIEKKNSEANKILKEEVKEVKDSIRELLKSVSDIEVLIEVQELLQGSVNDSQAELDI